MLGVKFHIFSVEDSQVLLGELSWGWKTCPGVICQVNFIRLVDFRVVQALPFDVLRFRNVYGECRRGMEKLRLGSMESKWIREDL